MAHLNRIHIGTSGWHYPHWVGPFYPEGLSKKNFLKYYADHFRTVEVNNTFYRLPEKKTFIDWEEAVPYGFEFSVKANRYITHLKKLKDPEKTLPPFLERIGVLGDKLGPVLFQLSPNWGLDIERLDAFLRTLPKCFKYTFEFRNADWFDNAVYELLERHGAAFCVYEIDRRMSPKVVTADFVYLRLHGPDGPYRGEYGKKGVVEWAREIRGWLKEGRSVYCYFDNDEAGYAVKDALKLIELLKKR